MPRTSRKRKPKRSRHAPFDSILRDRERGWDASLQGSWDARKHGVKTLASIWPTFSQEPLAPILPDIASLSRATFEVQASKQWPHKPVATLSMLNQRGKAGRMRSHRPRRRPPRMLPAMQRSVKPPPTNAYAALCPAVAAAKYGRRFGTRVQGELCLVRCRTLSAELFFVGRNMAQQIALGDATYEAKMPRDEEIMRAVAAASVVKHEMDAHTILKAEQRAKREAEQRAKREAEQRAKCEAEQRAKREAEQRAKREAEQRTKREAEQCAKREAEQRAQHDAEARRKRDKEERAKHEAGAKWTREEEEHAA